MAKDVGYFSENNPFKVLKKGECVDISAEEDGVESMVGEVCRVEKDGEDIVKTHIDVDGEEKEFEMSKSDYSKE